MKRPMPPLPSRTQALARHLERAALYNEILSRYTGSALPLTAAVIGTVDGILVAAPPAQPASRPAELAAMAGSLLAVATAAGREVGHSPAERLIIESGTGTLLVKPVGANADLVLCMALPRGTVLGKALWAADEIAKAVRAL